MQSRNIKTRLTHLTWLVTFALMFLLIPINIFAQLYLQHQAQRKAATQMFGQLTQLIETNKTALEREKDLFAQQCIRSADVVAYFWEHYPIEIIDLQHTRDLADKLDLDEIHFLTPQGEIYAGTHPEYYGITFHSGEQMQFFLPMLSDRSLKLFQGITPNTALGKEMIYAAVWLNDGSGIVQVGMEPWHLLELMDEQSLENVLHMMPFELSGQMHILDMNTLEIIASTEDHVIGLNLEEEAGGLDLVRTMKENSHLSYQGQRYCIYAQDYGDYLLIRSYLSTYSLYATLESTLLFFICATVTVICIIQCLRWFLDWKVVRNLRRFNYALEQNEDGRLEDIALNTGITEFDELQFHLNCMMENIRTNWDRISHIISKGKIPIGIFEQDMTYKKFFVNDYMLRMLNIPVDHTYSETELLTLVQQKLDQAVSKPVLPEELIYLYEDCGLSRYLRIEKEETAQSRFYYVTDVSRMWDEIEQIRIESEMDPLVRLYNRRGFQERISELFKSPDQIEYAMMIMLDADNLKVINDTYGHVVGDEYLDKIAESLNTTVGHQAICGRLGGDEFICFVYGSSSHEELEHRIDNLKAQRGRSFYSVHHPNMAYTVEFSVGISFYPQESMDFHALMRIADQKMYEEKKQRKLDGVLHTDNIERMSPQ